MALVGGSGVGAWQKGVTPSLPTNVVGFRGFDLSIILILRGGILMPVGDFPENLSRAMLVGTMSVGGLGVLMRHLPVAMHVGRS